MNGGVCLVADVDRQKLQRRLETRYLDEIAGGGGGDDAQASDAALDDAIDRARAHAAAGRAVSVGVAANAVALLERLLARGITPDALTDQTSAHDVMSYVPADLTLAAARALRTSDAARLRRAQPGHHGAPRARDGGAAIARRGHLRLRQQPAPARVRARLRRRVRISRLRARVHPSRFCDGRGPFRWAALSGDPEDIYAIDRALLTAFPDDAGLQRWITLARDRVAFQGLPARICWLGLGQRARAGRLFNDLVATGAVSAPIVIGRDHLDCGSVASPNRETEAMRDGSDAISDWPLLNALVSTASGASWVSFHHGGGVGIGYSQHAGQVTVADGTPDAAERIERVLTNDPALGVLRHADAGYADAIACAGENGLAIPLPARDPDE